ncbi:MAG: hypothetical protein NWT00_05135 [Beijerinckiaceae bacterium]|nr:hypothetical protein [Beijerinckiaceae bacterium]
MRIQRLLPAAPALFGAAWMPAAALAGAFMQPAGHGQAIITARFETSDTYLDSSGLARPVRDYRKFELQSWLEYGWNDAVTLIFAPSASQISTSLQANPLRRETKVSDTYTRVEAGARFRIHQSSIGAVAFQATAAVTEKLASANQFGIRYDRNELDLRLLFGRNFSFGTWSGYLDLQGGYRLRAGAPNEWRGDITNGMHILPQWLLLVQNFNLIAHKDAHKPGKRSHKAQVSLVYKLTGQWSLQAGSFTTFSARNARRDHGWLLAIWRGF